MFVEKPVTFGVADSRTAIEAAGRAGVDRAVGFNQNFHPSVVKSRQTGQESRLGTIVGALSERSALRGLHLTADAWSRFGGSPGLNPARPREPGTVACGGCPYQQDCGNPAISEGKSW